MYTLQAGDASPLWMLTKKLDAVQNTDLNNNISKTKAIAGLTWTMDWSYTYMAKNLEQGERGEFVKWKMDDEVLKCAKGLVQR